MGQAVVVIVVVEGPSAAGKTTWCQRHAARWLPEPGRWPMAEVLEHQTGRWRDAVAGDARGDVVVLDGDPFKLYYSWASWRLGLVADDDWDEAVSDARERFVAGDLGLADLVLYSDPGEDELRRRQQADTTRTRRGFEVHTRMRPHFRAWYEAVASLDPQRVVWSHPADGLTPSHLAVGPRPARSDPVLFDRLLERLDAHL